MDEPELRACVLIPTFDNGATLADVLTRAQLTGLAVLVVDDGSRDETPEILARTSHLVVARHPVNRGKGAALATGFDLALAHGFTHAITLDSDGQHFPEDVPTMLAAIRAAPRALVVGARDLAGAGAGPGSRFGCRCSNFWVFVATGVRLPDTQTGFRAYPLRAITGLALRSTRFGYEVEVLVKASWAGVPLASVPVRVLYPPPEERVSHFRPLVDFARIGALNAHLCCLRLVLPAPCLARIAQREFHALPLGARLLAAGRGLLEDGRGTPLYVASSVALGLFIGIAPFWGFQVALTLFLAHALRLSKTIAVVAAHVSFPLAIPAILYASLVLGRKLLGEPEVTTLDLRGADFWSWVVGSFALATLAAVTGFALTLGVLETRRARARGKAR